MFGEHSEFFFFHNIIKKIVGEQNGYAGPPAQTKTKPIQSIQKGFYHEYFAYKIIIITYLKSNNLIVNIYPQNPANDSVSASSFLQIRITLYFHIIDHVH